MLLDSVVQVLYSFILKCYELVKCSQSRVSIFQPAMMRHYIEHTDGVDRQDRAKHKFSHLCLLSYFSLPLLFCFCKGLGFYWVCC